jgi:hypothetical protein
MGSLNVIRPFHQKILIKKIGGVDVHHAAGLIQQAIKKTYPDHAPQPLTSSLHAIA